MKTKNIAKIGVLTALSIVLVSLIHIPIFPAVSFLEYDPADVPILLATFAMGPWAGFLMTVVVSVIQGLSVSAASSWYGMVMHTLATGLFSIVAGCIYKKEKTKKNAIKALVFGSLSMVLVMIPANLLLTPVYLQWFGMTQEVAKTMVKDLLLWIVLFNVVKTVLNSVITFLVYKRVSPLLHK